MSSCSASFTAAVPFDSIRSPHIMRGRGGWEDGGGRGSAAHRRLRVWPPWPGRPPLPCLAAVSVRSRRDPARPRGGGELGRLAVPILASTCLRPRLFHTASSAVKRLRVAAHISPSSGIKGARAGGRREGRRVGDGAAASLAEREEQESGDERGG